MLRAGFLGFLMVVGWAACGCAGPPPSTPPHAVEDATPGSPPVLHDPTQVPAPVARLDSAEIYYAVGDYRSVVRLLGRGPTARPRENLLFGWSLYRLGRMDESVVAFEKGLELAPDNLDLLNGHAFALYRTNQPERAEAAFRRILASNPDREESIRGLAAVLYTSQRFAECLPIADKLLRDHPGDSESEHHLVKSVDGMLTDWQHTGRTPADMVAEGWRLAEAGCRRSAFEIFRWVLLVDPFHPGARLGLGKLGPEFGHEAEARRALEELLHENPDDPQARAALARLHLEAGRVRDADAQVDALLAAHPGDRDGQALRNEIRSRNKKAP